MTNLPLIIKTLNAWAVDTVGRLSPTLQSQHNDIVGLLHYDGEAADYLEQNSCLHVFKEKVQVPTIYTHVDAFSSETVSMGVEDVDFAAEDEHPKKDQLTQLFLGTSENVQKYVQMLSNNKMSANEHSVHRRSKDENIASTKLDLYSQVSQDGLNPDHQVLAQSPDEQDDPFYSTRQEPDGCEGLGDGATPDSRPTTLAKGHEAKPTNLLTLFKYQVFGRSAIQEQSENLVQPCVTDLNHSAKVGLTEEPQRMTSAMSEKAYREITMTEVLDVLPTTGKTTNHPRVTSEEGFCHPHVAARTKHETDAILAGDGQEEMKGEECRGEGLDGQCSDGAGDDRQSSRKQDPGGQRSRQDCGQGNGQSQGAGGSSGGQSGSSGSGGDDEEDRKDKKRKDGKEDEEAEVSDEETSEEDDTQECFPDTEAEDDVSVTSEELSFTNRAVVEHRTQSFQAVPVNPQHIFLFLQALSRNLQSINGIQTLHQGMDRPAIRYLNTLSTRLQNLGGQGGGLSVVPQKPPTRQLQDQRSSLTRPQRCVANLLRRGTTVFESRQILLVGEDVVVVWLVRGILVDPNRQMLVLASVFLRSLGTAGTFAATLSLTTGRHLYTLSHCLPLFFVLETPVVFSRVIERGNCLRMVTGPVEAGSVGGVEPSLPQPSLPQPSLPQPSLPQPSLPQASLPQPSLPQPSLPQPSLPQPSLPQTSLPQPSLPQPSLPQFSLPQPSLPQAFLPQPSLPQPSLPQPSLPQPSLPQAFLPQPSLPQPSLPQASLPQPSLPQASLPERFLSQASPPQGLSETGPGDITDN
ncbi:hypothetical protein ACOMHN_037128 [Nucella lapillus]